ncbi:MAG: prolyl oligopeptidase family serine peptidase [Alistipes sp.]|nr:prolyl oligopeptidase family serine peptidase [Alistipes sp.]
MKRIILILLCLVVGIECYAQKIKVACVGNSITYGAYVINREKNNYPAQLQAYLGDKYEVKNFGVSATTALYKGLYPYVDTEKYRESLEYNPDIVIIKLGTNDANERNDAYRSTFPKDYRRLVDEYLNLPSHPQVILLTPVHCFLPSNQDEVIKAEIIPVIEQTAYERNLDIVNLHNLFGDEWIEFLMPDKLHPSNIGAGMLAQKIYQYIAVEKHDVDIIKNFPLKPVKEFNFHGYKGYEYDNNGVKYYIVKPHHTAKGNPWIWRARFWGHEPQVDIDLLEQGFHLTYCDVAELFGSPKAVERWDEFYALAIKAGLNQKAVLEGMSRGGLIIYNWAAKNPKKVACIYGDAPVMDIKSWPLNWGDCLDENKRSMSLLLEAYGFANAEEAMAWNKNPLNHARKLAKAKIPMIHVVGDIDEGVPVAENTAIFEREVAKYGHSLHVIHKPNVGHHPHSLNNPEKIVSFILKATGYKRNMCAYPVPGNEYRSAAGWSEGAEWYAVARDIEATLEGRKLKLLMLGNSITQGLGGERQRITSRAGQQAMDEAIGKGAWENAGISGDRTQHLLWRLKNCNYNRCSPEVAVITIGINNINAGDEAKDVAEGIVACAEEARRQMPDTRIILLGLLPADKPANAWMRRACDEVHAHLKRANIKDVEYNNPTSWFTLDNGELNTALYSKDNLHLSAEGYKVWSKKIAELIK